MSALTYYGSNDVGCYADGAFGHQHCRETLARLVEQLRRRSLGVQIDTSLIASLRGEMPDDAWDEDAALDLLNDHTKDGVTWTFENGDLLLLALEEES